MNNLFAYRSAIDIGIERWELMSAAKCCVVRLHRGIYAVKRICAKHPQFERLADPEMLRLIGRADAGARNAAWFQVQEKLHTAKAALIGRTVAQDSDVVSHSTAALIHGLPVLRIPESVQMINPGGSRKAESFVRRRRQIQPSDITDWNGVAVTTRIRTALDIAADQSAEDGAAVLDCVLRTDYGRKDQLLDEAREAVAANSRFSSSRRVREAVRFANGLAESYGESVCMVTLRMLGLHGLEQQAEIFDESGRFVARVDGLLREKRVIIEFDGAVKYRNSEYGGFNDDGDQLLREKNREHQLHRLGYTVVRIMWRDLGNISRLRERLRALGLLA